MPNNRISTLIILALAGFFVMMPGQNLPITWSQCYGTYDQSQALRSGSYALGFGINNFALYDPPYDLSDSVAYDERRFDIWGKYGLGRGWEFELKYASPTCLVMSAKRQLMTGPLGAAAKLGFGYMKGTRSNYLTDYVYDIYPGFILDRVITGSLRVYASPRALISIHQKDRQEHTTRPLRSITQYGFGLGLRLGSDFAVATESNWFWANNDGATYIVNQFGIGVNAAIK